MRKKIIAGNWKMNTNKEEAEALLKELKKHYKHNDKAELLVCVPAPHLGIAEQILSGTYIKWGAQNCYIKNNGAFTGENSPSTLKSYGCTYVLVGHSERREYFKESNEFLREKVDAALQQELIPVFCFGEKLEQREAGDQTRVVKQQLEESVFHLSAAQFSNVVLAYEPVWAIGTGLAATPEQAQDMHNYIRLLISNKYDQPTADNTSILYGGSMKPANAAELLSQVDIDGGLIGGASLKAGDFLDIAKEA